MSPSPSSSPAPAGGSTTDGAGPRITIAGYGSVGRYVEQLFSGFDLRRYDPPLGMGSASDLRDTDFVIVCVPTPAGPGGRCDTSIVEEVVALADPRRAIVCHSTVRIGTTARLAAERGKPVVFVPEYAGEAAEHPLRDPANRSFLIYGGDPDAVAAVRELYTAAYAPRRPDLRHHETTSTVAEVVKYMENAFLATKVAFCNDFYDLCSALGVDYEEVRTLWLEDDRIHPSHTHVTPERGYGGQCLPKDIAAVCERAQELGVPMAVLDGVRRANEGHRRRGEAVAAAAAPR